jgi:hypothetical protein
VSPLRIGDGSRTYTQESVAGKPLTGWTVFSDGINAINGIARVDRVNGFRGMSHIDGINRNYGAEGDAIVDRMNRINGI